MTVADKRPRLTGIHFAIPLLAALAGCPSGNNGSYDGISDGSDGEDTAGPGPVIEGVSPNRGAAAGGTVVEITGENFRDGIRAFFGSVESPSVNFRNSALITASTPPGDPGPVTVRVENPDGQFSELAGGFTYLEGEAITWCVLDRPESVTVFVDQATEPFYGIVEFPGHTTGPGEGGGLAAQAGFGPGGTDPDDDGWVWVDAGYHGDADGAVEGDMARDEYSAAFTPDAEGSFDAAFRFSIDGGATWVLCDMNALDFPAYDAGDAASLEVTRPAEIDYCILHQPTALTVSAGAVTEEILGRIRVVGHTDATAGEVDFITAEVGYGPDGSDPSTSTAWTWKGSSFDSDAGSEDQYAAVLTAPSATGAYDVAYRFSLPGGTTWTCCDTDGSDNGYAPADACAMTVEEPAVTVDWCATQWPDETWSGPGFETDPLYGRVFRSGVTEGAGAGAGITAQVGHGPRGSDPEAGGWTWTDASYFSDVDHLGSDDADEYTAVLTLAAAGDYSFAFRFSADGGGHWTLCDLDGSGDGFEPDLAGYLRIVTTTVPIDWCNTQWPSSLTVLLADETDPVYGQVFSSAGGTSASGRTMNIIAELGYGPDGSDPATSTAWLWTRANFNVDSGNNDEFMAALSGFSSAGTFDYAYRFTGDWGATWTVCDLGGSTDGYDPADAGALTVN
jgi:hypothetical protein